MLGRVFQALERIERQVLLFTGLRPGLRIAAVVAAVALGALAVGVVGAVLATTVVILLAAVGIVASATDLRPLPPASRAEVMGFYDHAVSNMSKTAG